MTPRRLALLSVYNKTGIVEFAQALVALGWDLLSSGGTAAKLREADLEVTDVADWVGGGAILGHKVVTLSRQVHAALLADTNSESELQELTELGIRPIDLVCVDLYPLEEEISKDTATPESVLEKTDIGGPTMLRSAAKGGRIVVCDVENREVVIQWLSDGEPSRERMIRGLRAEAELTVAHYCEKSARYWLQRSREV